MAKPDYQDLRYGLLRLLAEVERALAANSVAHLRASKATQEARKLLDGTR